jgi:hypothetical protein
MTNEPRQTSDLLTGRPNVAPLDVKPANALRGKPFHDHAVAFSIAFKIGDTLTPDKFDAWAHGCGFLDVPVEADKRSDVWLAHLHQLRYSINKAATHPRMREENRQPFTIDYAGSKVWEVRATIDAMQRDDTARKLTRLAVVQRRKLLYLQQSEDFVELPQYLRLAVLDLSAEINQTLRETSVIAEGLEARIQRVIDRVQASIEAGEVTPKNDGIRGLLSDAENED